MGVLVNSCNRTDSQVLKLAAWNVHGLGTKIDDSQFVNRLMDFHICFLIETWTQSNFSIAGKYVFCKHATKNDKKKK